MRGKTFTGCCFCLLLLAAAAAPSPATPSQAPAAPARPPLKIAAIQLRLEAEMLGSYESFQRRVASLVAEAAAFGPDLIVFPEYTGVFLALVPYAELWAETAPTPATDTATAPAPAPAPAGAEMSMEAALAAIQEREPLLGSPEELFLLNSGLAERALESIFGGLARRYRVHILAGSYFAWEGEPGSAGRLRNRAVVYGPGGRRVYTQDKVFLTDFETGLLNLAPGSRRAAVPFRIAGHSLGLTICRDTYDRGWEKHFAGLDVWIDIKANGAAYTEEERRSFLRALPARIEASGVPLGLTVCLTGEFLDLFWEGKSSLVGKDPGGVRVLWQASAAREEEIALLTLDADLTIP